MQAGDRVSSDLPRILAAWEEATDRLRGTHEVLRDEVRRLTRELESKNRELARKDRLADLGQMAGHLAHEVRNGLMPLTLYLSLLRRHVADRPKLLELADKLAAGFAALEVTVNDLLHFTSDRPPSSSSFALRPVVDEILSGVSRQLEAVGIRVEVDVAPGIACWADRHMVHRALLNLVLNAIDAMPQGGELSITACLAGGTVEVEIADSGPGLSHDALGRLCEPFFTTKSTGTGLGLAIVDRIVDAHGGTLWAANCPQGGAAFTVRFPLQGEVRRAA